jgi:hypothetical protein
VSFLHLRLWEGKIIRLRLRRRYLDLYSAHFIIYMHFDVAPALAKEVMQLLAAPALLDQMLLYFSLVCKLLNTALRSSITLMQFRLLEGEMIHAQ